MMILVYVGLIASVLAVIIGLLLATNAVYWSIKAWRAKREFFRAARAAGLENEKFSIAAWRQEHER